MVFVLTILTPFCAAGACAAWDRPCRSTGDTSALSLPRAAFAPLSDAVLRASATPDSHARLPALWAWRISRAYGLRKIAVPSQKRCTSTMMAEKTTRTFSVKSRSRNGGHPSTLAQAPASSMSPEIPRTSLTISTTDLPPTSCSRARLCTYSHRLAFAISLTQCPSDAPTYILAAQPRPNPTHSRPRTSKKASLSRVTRPQPSPIQSR